MGLLLFGRSQRQFCSQRPDRGVAGRARRCARRPRAPARVERPPASSASSAGSSGPAIPEAMPAASAARCTCCDRLAKACRSSGPSSRQGRARGRRSRPRARPHRPPPRSPRPRSTAAADSTWTMHTGGCARCRGPPVVRRPAGRGAPRAARRVAQALDHSRGLRRRCPRAARRSPSTPASRVAPIARVGCSRPGERGWPRPPRARRSRAAARRRVPSAPCSRSIQTKSTALALSSASATSGRVTTVPTHGSRALRRLRSGLSIRVIQSLTHIAGQATITVPCRARKPLWPRSALPAALAAYSCR